MSNNVELKDKKVVIVPLNFSYHDTLVAPPLVSPTPLCAETISKHHYVWVQVTIDVYQLLRLCESG